MFLNTIGVAPSSVVLLILVNKVVGSSLVFFGVGVRDSSIEVIANAAAATAVGYSPPSIEL